MSGRGSIEEMNGKLFSVEEECYILRYNKANHGNNIEINAKYETEVKKQTDKLQYIYLIAIFTRCCLE